MAAALVTSPSGIAAQSSAGWTPAVLDDHQNRTVVALTDLIIPETDTPGAKAVNTNRFIDLLLKDGDQPVRERFLAGLASLDAQSMRASGHPFVSCSRDQQTALLEKMDRARDPFFNLAKNITARIYYSTQAGFRELNKGGRVPASFGCAHPNHG